MIEIVEKTRAYDFTLKRLLGGDPASLTLDKVCCDINNSIVGTVLNWSLDLLGLIAFIMIIYASITYLISYGDENRAAVAKKTLLWSIVGIVIVIFSRVIMNLVYDLLK